MIGAIPTLLFIGQLKELTAKGDGLFKFGVSIVLLPLLFLFLYFVFAISIAMISRKYKKKKTGDRPGADDKPTGDEEFDDRIERRRHESNL